MVTAGPFRAPTELAGCHVAVALESGCAKNRGRSQSASTSNPRAAEPEPLNRRPQRRSEPGRWTRIGRAHPWWHASRPPRVVPDSPRTDPSLNRLGVPRLPTTPRLQARAIPQQYRLPYLALQSPRAEPELPLALGLHKIPRMGVRRRLEAEFVEHSFVRYSDSALPCLDRGEDIRRLTPTSTNGRAAELPPQRESLSTRCQGRERSGRRFAPTGCAMSDRRERYLKP